MNVIGPVCVIAHDCALFASVLVGLLHCVCVPVRPVDPVLKQGHSKDMGECTSDGPVTVLTIHVCKAEGGYSGGLIHAVGISIKFRAPLMNS